MYIAVGKNYVGCPTCDGDSDNTSLFYLNDYLDVNEMASLCTENQLENIFLTKEFNFEPVFSSISISTSHHSISRVLLMEYKNNKHEPKYIAYDRSMFKLNVKELTIYLVDSDPLVRDYAERLLINMGINIENTITKPSTTNIEELFT